MNVSTLAGADIGLGSWPARRARISPARTALTQADRSLTYAELADRTERLAGALARLGVQRGDRVAYLGVNVITVFETLFAAGLLGAIFVPLNYRLSGSEIRYMLRPLQGAQAPDLRARAAPQRHRKDPARRTARTRHHRTPRRRTGRPPGGCRPGGRPTGWTSMTSPDEREPGSGPTEEEARVPLPGLAGRGTPRRRRGPAVLEGLGLAEGASVERLQFVTDLADAVADADADFQENGPEREDVKHALFAVLDEATRPDVILPSSSSGMLPTTIARGCPAHPGRVVIGHPFNPPHLIPLVEVVPGEQTSPETVDRAVAFYTAVRKGPIRLRQELPGHVANRLQAALWQEAYSLVERGVATVADIDTAISQGPGLRWAVLGQFANQHLSGGPGGLAHILEHLGPPGSTRTC
jgi:hypothetical protein